MTDRLRELLELPATTLLDIDEAGNLLVGNDASGTTQLAEIGPDGTWRQLTQLGEPCTGRYVKGERAVIVSADDGGTERAQLWRLPIGGALEPLVQDPRYIHTLLDVQPDSVVYSTNRRNGVDFDVIRRSLSTGEEQIVWAAGGWIEDAAFSPNGRWVVLQRMTLLPASTELLLIDLEAGTFAGITNDKFPGEWSNPRWIDDNSVMASTDAVGDRVSLLRYDLAAAAWRDVLAFADHDVRGWPSPDGQRLAVVRTSDGADELLVASLDGSDAVLVPLPPTGVITYRSPIVWSPDSARLGFTYSSPVRPPAAMTWSAEFGVVQRTTPPAGLADLVVPESVTVPTRDGEQVPTFVLTPRNADGSVVVFIHGGPEAASVRSWNPIIAALALDRHIVVVPNVRGSAGYGRRWMSLDDVGKRLDSVADLAAIHAWLPMIGADRTRAALYGGSYGGYMVLAGLAFQPSLWAAGVDIVGMSSLVTFLENTSDYRRAYREREYGRLDTDLAILQAASPLGKIGDVRAPLFVIHGANDPRVPLSEAAQVVEAVRKRGFDCPLLVYPDEGHGLAKRANKLDAYPRVLAFLTRHLSLENA
jgi:dipeptidyl aminopeptidase/acylaminoacyl peptidase